MRAADATGFVLAGGRSSRMGTDKALVEFRGRPLVVHALEILRGAGLSAAIAGAKPTAQPILDTYAPLFPDREPGLGPLGGVCAAMASTTARWAVFLPVDLPLLPAMLVQYLLNHAQVTGKAITLASVAGFAQTFPAVVDRAALLGLQAELTADRGGCFSAFKAAAAGLEQSIDVISAEFLAQSGQVSHPEGLSAASWFLNINSADDLRLAETEWKNGARRP
jgi:molybdopterin-guanine dinucleotide biosynthesis protein A